VIVPYVSGGSTAALAGKCFGKDFMRCPSAGPAYTYTYGVNYGPVFGWNGQGIPPSSKLDKVPFNVYLVADAHFSDANWALIYSPAYRYWKFDQDLDNDGIKDTGSRSQCKFNGASFDTHGDGSNYLFPDGHVKWLNKKAWLSNKDGLWGYDGWTYRYGNEGK
jgi:prepilin-type processing-associated H-X9-DG protein